MCTNSSKTVNETKINVLSQQHAKDWILCSPMLHNITRPHYQLFGLRPRPKQVSWRPCSHTPVPLLTTAYALMESRITTKKTPSHQLIYSIPAQKGQTLLLDFLLDVVVYFQGWQYSQHRSYYEYGPEEKAFDMSRRRRLIRPRRRDLNAKVKQVRGTSDFKWQIKG